MTGRKPMLGGELSAGVGAALFPLTEGVIKTQYVS
jgi:hypothetical protein